MALEGSSSSLASPWTIDKESQRSDDNASDQRDALRTQRMAAGHEHRRSACRTLKSEGGCDVLH